MYEIASKLKIPVSSVESHVYTLSHSGQTFPVGRKENWKQKAILWSTSKKGKLYAGYFKHEAFSRMLLDELATPKTARQLAEKFSREPGSICYHLRKLRKKGFVETNGRSIKTLWRSRKVKGI